MVTETIPTPPEDEDDEDLEEGEEELKQRFTIEFSRLNGIPFTLQTDAVTAWAIASQLQLALRHPQNTGPTSEMARQAAIDIFNTLAAPGTALAQIAEGGWHREYDVKVVPNE